MPNGNIFRQILGFWQYFPPNLGFLEIISAKTLIFGNISHQLGYKLGRSRQ
jgi:hypothetical protein